MNDVESSTFILLRVVEGGLWIYIEGERRTDEGEVGWEGGGREKKR